VFVQGVHNAISPSREYPGERVEKRSWSVSERHRIAFTLAKENICYMQLQISSQTMEH
jgi:membrane-bound lytic murein transglycosylase MltF